MNEKEKERRKLCVIGNKIGDKGAKALCEMLKVKTTLKTLDLRGVGKSNKKKTKERTNEWQTMKLETKEQKESVNY